MPTFKNFFINKHSLLSNFYKSNIIITRLCSFKSVPLLSPWFITGFTDGEGSFWVSILKDNTYKTGWSVKLGFEIRLHKKDRALLEHIQKFLGVGKIYTKNKRGPVKKEV